MNNSPKISFIVPVYNVEKYLKECMESLINQTFYDIEIICVNDCSTDGSLNILKKFRESDKRVVIIDKTENEGTMLARKSGVEQAKGEYIIFVDSDDYVDCKLAEFVNGVADKAADIIHFSSGIYDAEGNDHKGLKDLLSPCVKELNNYDIVTELFITKNIATQLWGKAFKAELLKKAHNVMPYEKCYIGEDVFTAFIIAYYAQKYIGINTPELYWYRFGAGVTSFGNISLSKFEMYCKMSNWIKYAYDFISEKEQLIKTAYEQMKTRLFEDCCEMFQIQVSKTDRFDALLMIYKYWSDIELDDDLWKKNTHKSKEYIKHQYEIAECVKFNKNISTHNPEISVIIYLHNEKDNVNNILDFAINQSFNDIEIICINDGSDDTTLDVLEELSAKDSRIVIINQKHRGKSASYNKAVEISSGKYLYFTDNSCVLNKTAFEYLLKNDEDVDVIYFDSEYNEKNILSGNEKYEHYIKKGRYSSSLSTQLIKRSMIIDNKIRFDDFIINSEMLFSDILISCSKNIKVLKAQLSEKKHTKQEYFAVDETGFIDSFKTFAILSSMAIISSDEDEAKSNILTYLSKKYNSICKDIYINLSDTQRNFVNFELGSEYKPFLFSIRECINIKSSLAYKIGKFITGQFKK